MGAPDPLPKLNQWSLDPTAVLKTARAYKDPREAEAEKARQKLIAEAAAQRSRELALALRTTVLAQLQIGDLRTTQHYELDTRLAAVMNNERALTALASIVNDKSVPIEQREKLLEVMILRSTQSAKTDYTEAVTGIGKMAVGYSPAAAYQDAAARAVQNDPDLFKELSRSGDNLPPPSSRAPATELVYSMLRDRDRTDAQENQNRQSFEKWVKELPPETQGRAMFHLADAAGTKDYDETAHVTGFEVSFKEVGFGIQWDRAPDTHWAQVGGDVSRGVIHDINAKGDDAKAAFSKGFQAAKMAAPE